MSLPSGAPHDPSWWLTEALAAEGAVADFPALEGSIAADVAIVGGGYTGLWTALALKERAPRLNVALIEAAICGAGASGKNGGKCHGYWSSLPTVVAGFGDAGALAAARASSKAQDGIRAFVKGCGRDVWWREAGMIKVAAAPAQDAAIARHAAEARRLGVPDAVVPLSLKEMQARCASPAFRGAVLYPEGANVHPARLVRALRAAAAAAGVQIYEHSPLIRLETGAAKNAVATPKGRIEAPEIVLATNTALAAYRAVRRHITNFSSFALMTDPNPDGLRAIGWNGEEGISDARMFIHYLRKTPDGRVLMGSGTGPVAFDGNDRLPRLSTDRASAERAERGLRRLLPGLGAVGIAHAWGGAIDVSSDRLPFFKTLPGTRVHYGCGYSGHGVNATYIGGQCLASLVLKSDDEWSRLPFCTRQPPRLPPEPFRYWGGAAIRRAIMSCEEAEEEGRTASWAARAVAALPARLGLRIGVR